MNAPSPPPPPSLHLLARVVIASTRRRAHVIAAVLALALIAGFVARRLQLDAMPDITSNQVQILTRAPGLTPEEVERLVTRRIEVALGGLPGVDEQRSLSRFGISAVTVVFDDDVDPWRARQQVQERIGNLAAELPAGVEPPALGPHTGGLGEVFHLTLASPGRSQAELLELVELRVAPLLRAVEGVVEVNTWGGRRRTLEIRADPMRMARRGVTLDALSIALSRASGAAPGGSVSAGAGAALLRGVHWPAGPVDLGAAVVRSDAAGVVRVADVADVAWGDLLRLGAATANGRGETTYVMVQMALHANAFEVVQAVWDRMPEIWRVLPEDVRVDIVYDRSELVTATLHTVGRNLAEGAVLVIIVLVAMLGSLRAGLLVASVIPLSMLGAGAGMVVFGIPGNLMSLGAIDFGLLVDGAVVVVERVFHVLHHQRALLEHASGEARGAVVERAMANVAAPMAFSVAVIVLVYAPILALQGVDGKMFRPMALTVVFALACALVLSLTWVPAVAGRMRPKDVPTRPPLLARAIEAAYAPVLRFAVGRPTIVLAGAAASLGLGGWVYAQLGTSFVPQLDEGDLVIQVTRAADISLEHAIEDAGRLEQRLLAVPEVRGVTSRIGSPAVATDIMGLEQADVFVDLAERDQWREGLDRDALLAEMNALLDPELTGERNVEFGFTQPIQMRFNELLGGAVTDVAIELYGEDLAELQRVANELRDAAAGVEGAHDVRVLAPPNVPVVDVRPKVVEAALLGMDAAQVLDVVRAIRVGVDVGGSWDGPVRIPMRLRVHGDVAAFDLAALPVATPAGTVVPLSRIADIETVLSPALVNRHEAQRRVLIGFNVRERSLGDVVAEVQTAIDAQVEVPRGMRLRYGGQFESLQQARARLTWVIPAVMVGIVVTLVLLFRAIGPALMIFLNVPFAGVGGVLALAARGLPVSISAAVGFIALSGIAVLNGVMLVSALREFQRAGYPIGEAVVLAARERVRPVSMTALVAALGFVPMALATGVGAEVQRPLATVVVGGLITSTALTLVVLPALYHGFGRLVRARSTTKTTP